MTEAIESAPVHITNMSLPQAPDAVVTETPETDTTTTVDTSDTVDSSHVELTEEQKADAEAKALEAEREATAKAKAEEERKAKFDRAKKIADRETQRQAERRALQMQQRRLETERQQALVQLQAERAQREQYEELIKSFRADPTAHLEKMGIRAEDIAKKALEDNTPENQLARMQAELREEREALRKEREEQQRRQQVAQQQAAIEAGRRDFITKASNEDHYPYLAAAVAVNPRGIIAEAENVLRTAMDAEGVQYSDDEVREFLNQRYEQLVTRAAQKLGSGKSTDASTAKTKETNLGTSAQEKPAAGKPQTTLTNKANTRGTAPPALDEMDDATAKRVMAEMLRASRSRG